jgi:hypothetical protein
MSAAARKAIKVEKRCQGIGEEITGIKVTNPKTVLGACPGEEVGFRDFLYSTMYIEFSGLWKAFGLAEM